VAPVNTSQAQTERMLADPPMKTAWIPEGGGAHRQDSIPAGAVRIRYRRGNIVVLQEGGGQAP